MTATKFLALALLVLACASLPYEKKLINPCTYEPEANSGGIKEISFYDPNFLAADKYLRSIHPELKNTRVKCLLTILGTRFFITY